MKSLLRKNLEQFILCTVIVLLLATPLFYLLVKNFYAEDLFTIINAAQHNQPLPDTDLEKDMMEGIVFQFGLIALALSVSLVFVLRFISKHIWISFDDTLKRIERFTLEGGALPEFMETDVKEFARLNTALTQLMENNLHSYNLQMEFTENASHELQTPLAVFQSKLDLLLQHSDLTRSQAEIVQSLYEVSARLSRLSRNLLLLAKIDNNQYKQTDSIDILNTIKELLPFLTPFTQGLTIRTDFQNSPMLIRANNSLLGSLINNLTINAVRHNIDKGEITISAKDYRLTVSNTSNEGELNQDLLFSRFNRTSEKMKGNGLGLAIVKAICDYHGWQIQYKYLDKKHLFVVTFK